MKITTRSVDEVSIAADFEPDRSDLTITRLVDRYARTLYRIAFLILHCSQQAEESVQDTFVRVLKHRDQLAQIREPKVWLIRIVWNIALDEKGRAKTRPKTQDISLVERSLQFDGSVDERAAAIQHRERILECVDHLPDKEREVLLLSAFEELDSVEIA